MRSVVGISAEGIGVAVALLGMAASASAQEPNPLPPLDPPELVTDEDPIGDAPPAPEEEDVVPPEFSPQREPTPPAAVPAAALPRKDPRDVKVRLVYSSGPWGPTCPSLEEVRRAIVDHLGYEPFGEPSERVVLLLLDGDGREPARARVELLDAALVSLGTRTVASDDGCAELVATAALQVAIALDPARAGTPAPPAPAADPAAAPPPSVTPTPTAPPPPESAPEPPVADDVVVEVLPRGLRPLLGLSTHVAALLAPDGPMLGLAASVGVRSHAVSGRLEARADFTGNDNGTSSLPLLVSTVPCAHLPIWELGDDGALDVMGCLTMTAGVIPSLGTYFGFGLYGGAGARVGIDWRVDDDTTVRAFGQIEGAALRPRFTSLSGSSFESPGVNVVVGVGADLPGW